MYKLSELTQELATFLMDLLQEKTIQRSDRIALLAVNLDTMALDLVQRNCSVDEMEAIIEAVKFALKSGQGSGTIH